MKELIDSLNQELISIHDSICKLASQIEYINKQTGLPIIFTNKSVLEQQFKNITKAVKALQNICKHEWDTGTYERSYFYYTCKICGAHKGDY